MAILGADCRFRLHEMNVAPDPRPDAPVHSFYSRAGTILALRNHGLAASRERSQNFLFDANVIDACLRACDIRPADRVLEIGPGLGHTTRRLLERGAEVVAIELDHGLAAVVESLEVDGVRPRVIRADACQVDLATLWDDETAGVKLIGNLPYSAGSAILFHVLRDPRLVRQLGVCVQHEFAVRMCAGPGTKDYGRLSVMVQTLGTPTIRRKVPPTVFYPRPKVDSAFVTLTPHIDRPSVQERTFLEDLVRAAFSMRRKQLARALDPWAQAQGLSREQLLGALAEVEIPAVARAENVTVKQYVQLSRALAQGR